VWLYGGARTSRQKSPKAATSSRSAPTVHGTALSAAPRSGTRTQRIVIVRLPIIAQLPGLGNVCQQNRCVTRAEKDCSTKKMSTFRCLLTWIVLVSPGHFASLWLFLLHKVCCPPPTPEATSRRHIGKQTCCFRPDKRDLTLPHTGSMTNCRRLLLTCEVKLTPLLSWLDSSLAA